jgi:hypothetical protein
MVYIQLESQACMNKAKSVCPALVFWSFLSAKKLTKLIFLTSIFTVCLAERHAILMEIVKESPWTPHLSSCCDLEACYQGGLPCLF